MTWINPRQSVAAWPVSAKVSPRCPARRRFASLRIRWKPAAGYRARQDLVTPGFNISAFHLFPSPQSRRPVVQWSSPGDHSGPPQFLLASPARTPGRPPRKAPPRSKGAVLEPWAATFPISAFQRFSVSCLNHPLKIRNHSFNPREMWLKRSTLPREQNKNGAPLRMHELVSGEPHPSRANVRFLPRRRFTRGYSHDHSRRTPREPTHRNFSQAVLELREVGHQRHDQDTARYDRRN